LNGGKRYLTSKYFFPPSVFLYLELTKLMSHPNLGICETETYPWRGIYYDK